MNSENFLRGFLIVAMIAGLVLLIGGWLRLLAEIKAAYRRLLLVLAV